MRVTSGLFKSRIIKDPRHIRPTQDKVREALFDMLRPEVASASFLELFAGSGAVGIEALSNGAKEVVFVEEDKRCCKIIENNLVQLGLMPESQNTARKISIFAVDALKAIEFFCGNKKKFDIIFLDPPYYENLARKTLQKLSACDILSPHGLIVAEHSKKDLLEKDILNLTSFKQKIYGDKVLSFYNKVVS